MTSEEFAAWALSPPQTQQAAQTGYTLRRPDTTLIVDGDMSSCRGEFTALWLLQNHGHDLDDYQATDINATKQGWIVYERKQ